MLELELTSRSAIHRVVLPFDDIQLHGPVLRDAIGVDFVVIMDADDPQAQHALDHLRLDSLEACRHLELGNPDTSPLRLALTEADAALTNDSLAAVGRPPRIRPPGSVAEAFAGV